MIRYAITNGEYAGRVEALLAQARHWAQAEIEFVQLREKAMQSGELVTATRAMMQVFHEYGGRTKLLVNGRVDIAIVAATDGVHLTARRGEMSPEQSRRLFSMAGRVPAFLSVSCHSMEEVARAATGGANLILFGPVFEKQSGGQTVTSGSGLEALQQACDIAAGTPVLALGGVTANNAERCTAMGAAGIAGIRLFAHAPGRA